jgi:DNA-binding MarR family transcriptional regulator
MNALDKKLIETEHIRKTNWVKLISILKRQFNDWTMARLNEHGYNDFKIVYMPVLMNISPEGINNNELAVHAGVTKQAMSKVLKDLHQKGYIRSKVDPRDKRSTIVMLTERGKKMVIKARMSVWDLTSTYKTIIKASDYDRATDILLKIISYNDQFLLPKK